ncbi:unnamed protein product [Caenorhabditis sp. 36 PRJEB53466]|nr:unnamed protein product [Caenorhabditis sp. 36 PRJEB53466]
MNWISYYLGNHPRRVLLAVFCALIPLLRTYQILQLYNISVGGLEIWGVLARNKSLEDDLTINLKLLNEVDRLHQFVWNYTAQYKGETIRFKDLAAEDINYVFNYYRKLLAIEWLPGVDLSYPLASAFGHQFYLGSQFFGVNNGQVAKEGPIKTAKFVALWYMSKAETFEEKQKLQSVQLGIFRKSAEGFSDLYNFEMFGDQVANAEMLRGTLTTVKLFVIGGILMIAFMAFTFIELTTFSKCMLILGAIGSPLAATGACFAILGWIGHPFNSIMCITPFLILGIGVDDAFLLLNCWRREESKEPHLKSAKEAENQLARVVREISPSMAITSLTNTMAFGVGFLSPTPQMSSFCLGTALAIVLDFLFEFLIFVPCMVMFYEKRVEKPSESMEKNEKRGSHQSSGRISWRSFTNGLLSIPGRALVILLYAALFTASYLGAASMETTFDPSKTFPSDSKLVDSLHSFTTIQEEYSPLNFLSKVPDLSNEADVANFEEMLRRLEFREGCYGTVGSHNIYRDYKQYLNLTSSDEKSYDKLETFLKGRGMADRGTIKWHKEGNETIVDFVNFVVVCQGRPSWSERAVNVEKTRQILADFPEYNTTLFDYDGTIYDLIITVKGELVKSLAITFTCMTIACFVIMPSFVAPTIASVATVSISFSLVGFLSIWGQNLDPVTMIDVIMAIGFSVDYSAHVCYHYYCARKSETNSKQEVITRVLQAVGRPVIEASLTTLLCMAPLFVVPVYMIRSFAKTVTLVTTFGLLHGLFFLPVVLYFIPLDAPKHSLPTFTPSTQPLVSMEDDENFPERPPTFLLKSAPSASLPHFRMSFLSNDFGNPPAATSPPTTISPMPKIPTIQDMLNNIGASTVNLMQNPYLQQNQIPLTMPQLTFNPFLHLNPAISQEIIQQFLAMSFNAPTVLAGMANIGEDEGTCNPKMRRGDLLKSASLDSTEDPPASAITFDNNGDMIVPNNDKEGWCRNKKYIERTENGYMCTVCRKVYGRYNSVSYHVTIYHRNPPIKCNMPNCQFTTREARYIHFHKYYRHGIPLPQSIDQGSRKCPHCRHVSKSPAMLEKHIRRHQLKDDRSTDSSVDLLEAMRERTSTICDETMDVEPVETDVVLETKPRSCTL